MELRNLTRHYTFEKARAKYNKSAPHRLKAYHIGLMLAFHRQSKRTSSATIRQLSIEMQQMRMSGFSQIIQRSLQYLMKCGYVEQLNEFIRFKTVYYRLTLDGINELFELEKIHRIERLER